MGRLKGVICDTGIGSSSRWQHKKALNSLISNMLDKEFKVVIIEIQRWRKEWKNSVRPLIKRKNI